MLEPHPQTPSEAPPRTMELGGLIPWFSVSLTIAADGLDPDAVTRLLGTEPDDADRKGNRNVKGLLRRVGM